MWEWRSHCSTSPWTPSMEHGRPLPARSEFFSLFQIRGSDLTYTLRTGVQGSLKHPGEEPQGSWRSHWMAAAQHHTHLKSIAHKIPHLDPEAQILVLLGRDILQVHNVREQRNGPHSAPICPMTRPWLGCYRRCLLGVGQEASGCDLPDDCAWKWTSITPHSINRPNHFQVKEKFSIKALHYNSLHRLARNPPALDDWCLGSTIFERTKDEGLRGSLDWR